MEGRCLSIGESVGYGPFIDILKSYFGFNVNDTERERAEKITMTVTDLLSQQVTQSPMGPGEHGIPQSGADEVLPLLGNLLSVKFGNELDDLLNFATPEQIKHRTFMALRDLFVAMATPQPLVLVLEDLHWADNLSMELITLFRSGD